MDRVAYKPLSSGAKEDDDDDEEENPFSDDPLSQRQQQHQYHDHDHDGYFYHESHYKHWLLPNYCANLFELRQLRNLLYTLAIILSLIFLALLTFRNNNTSIDNRNSNISESISLPQKLTSSKLEPAQNQISLSSKNREELAKAAVRIQASKSFNYNSSITLTTHSTIEFLYHSLELCKRWDGPISLAVFVPGPEIKVATTLIKYMRQCLPVPLSACIRDKLTWHFVHDNKSTHHQLAESNVLPKEHLDKDNFPLFVEQDLCPKLAGPNPDDLIKQFEEELRKKNGLFPNNYRQQFKLTYPINVLRNIARLAAQTKYILAADIELYPSINLVPSFINYIQKHDVRRELGQHIEKYIFTLPIFEVKPTKSPPKTKSELVRLVQNGDAIFFHKWVCDACQAFPNRLDWLQTDKFGVENFHQPEDSDEICVFEVTQRDKSKSSWEPIFIGTNDDPLYDDRLTWDGRRDKMGQMFEMCLQNYYLLVIGNAFLVHAPGIKHIDQEDVIKRYDFMRKNNLIYDATMDKLKKQYANSSNINKC